MDKNNSNNPTKDDDNTTSILRCSSRSQTKNLAIQARTKKDDENVESDEFKPNQFNEVQTEYNRMKRLCPCL